MKYLVTYTDRDGCTFETVIKADAFVDHNGLIYFMTGEQVSAMFPVDVVVSVIAQEPIENKTDGLRDIEVNVDVDISDSATAQVVKQQLERLFSSIGVNLNTEV